MSLYKSKRPLNMNHKLTTESPLPKDGHHQAIMCADADSGTIKKGKNLRRKEQILGFQHPVSVCNSSSTVYLPSVGCLPSIHLVPQVILANASLGVSNRWLLLECHSLATSTGNRWRSLPVHSHVSGRKSQLPTVTQVITPVVGTSCRREILCTALSVKCCQPAVDTLLDASG